MKNAKVLILVIGIICLSGWLWSAVPVFASESSADETVREITEPNEMIAVLDLIGTCIQGNYSKIQTWTGQAEVEIKYLHTGKNAQEIFQSFTDGKGEPPIAILQTINEQFEFAIDTQKNFVYTDSFRIRPSQYVDPITKQDLGNKGSNPYRLTSIAVPDYLIQAKPKSVDSKEKQIIASWAKKVSSQRDLSTGLYNEMDDPRMAFSPGGVFPWKSFDLIQDKIQKNGRIEFDGYQYKIYEIKRGDQQDFKIIHPAVINLERSSPEHYVITTKICSEKYGYNFTEWKIARGDGLLLTEYFWEYDLVDGIYLPKIYIEKQYNSTGEVIREKRSLFIRNTINQPIDPEIFGYKSLHLTNGDLFIDEMENKKFRYNESTSNLEEIAVDK
jgi:hypothetical protein